MFLKTYNGLFTLFFGGLTGWLVMVELLLQPEGKIASVGACISAIIALLSVIMYEMGKDPEFVQKNGSEIK